jgi:hypothetical protein
VNNMRNFPSGGSVSEGIVRIENKSIHRRNGKYPMNLRLYNCIVPKNACNFEILPESNSTTGEETAKRIWYE